MSSLGSGTIALAFVFIVFVGFPYFIVPFLIKSNYKTKRRPDFYNFDPATLPPQVAQFFYQSVQTMIERGFNVVAYITKPNVMNNVSPVIAYLYNPVTGDMVTVATTYVTVNGVTTPKNNSIFINRRYSDGTIIGVSSIPRSLGAGSFKPRPNYKGAGLYDLLDIDKLYKLHLFAVELNTPMNAEVIKLQPGNELEAFHKYDEDVNTFQVRSGILRFDQQTDCFYATTFGAFYMTWKMLFPFKSLLILKNGKKGSDLVAKYQAKYGAL